MSVLRLLALSYLASASVFVVAATVVARPDLAREFAAGAGAISQAAAEKLRPPPAEEPVARLDLAPPTPQEVRLTARAGITPQQRHQVEAGDRFTNPDFAASAIIPILPDLFPESAPVPAEPKLVEPNPIQPNVRIGSASPPAIPKPAIPKPESPRLPPVHDRLT